MKAILVINMPDDIDFETLERARICFYKKDVGRYIYRNARLKPLPQKKEVKGDFYAQRRIATKLNDLIDFDKGYNKCIDEILGGKNE